MSQYTVVVTDKETKFYLQEPDTSCDCYLIKVTLDQTYNLQSLIMERKAINFIYTTNIEGIDKYMMFSYNNFFDKIEEINKLLTEQQVNIVYEEYKSRDLFQCFLTGFACALGFHALYYTTNMFSQFNLGGTFIDSMNKCNYSVVLSTPLIECPDPVVNKLLLNYIVFCNVWGGFFNGQTLQIEDSEEITQNEVDVHELKSIVTDVEIKVTNISSTLDQHEFRLDKIEASLLKPLEELKVIKEDMMKLREQMVKYTELLKNVLTNMKLNK